jgi:hypothetical protein
MPSWSAAEWRTGRIDGNQGEIFVATEGGAGGSAQVNSAQPHTRAYPALTMVAAKTGLRFLGGIHLPVRPFDSVPHESTAETTSIQDRIALTIFGKKEST